MIDIVALCSLLWPESLNCSTLRSNKMLLATSTQQRHMHIRLLLMFLVVCTVGSALAVERITRRDLSFQSQSRSCRISLCVTWFDSSSCATGSLTDECNMHKGVALSTGAARIPGLQVPLSSAKECCKSCPEHSQCQAWSWCFDPEGIVCQHICVNADTYNGYIGSHCLHVPVS